MSDIFGISIQALSGQLLLGLINGSFYALLSLGLAVIFGLLNIINFAHGALYMLGAFAAWMLLNYFGIGYWPSLVIAPVLVGLLGAGLERLLLKRLVGLDNLYGFLLTYGVALVLQALLRQQYGASGLPYPIPEALQGGIRLPFMFLSYYRAWVVVASVSVCLVTWFVIERTKLGSVLRAATENANLVRAFGIRVPRLVTLTYGSGVGLAALAGVLAAPIYQVSPLMGTDIIITVFAIVVIGGMGSILGSIVTGFALGLSEGMMKVIYPEASATIVFVIMVGVLVFRPQGLFGKPTAHEARADEEWASAKPDDGRAFKIAAGCISILLLLAPLVLYPQFLMKAMCFAIFAMSFNLLLGYSGLLSFGHAMFMGGAAYIAAHAAKVWGFPPELAILGGVVSALVGGLLVGLIAVRRQGIYFAMITLALSQMAYLFFLKAAFTGGEDGIQGVPRAAMFGIINLANVTHLYMVIFTLFIGTLLFTYRVIHSPFGEILKAIRENEPRAISLGYRTDRYKLAAFILSAGLAGLAGSAKVFVFQLASLTEAHWSNSGEAVLMTLVGGLGTVLGPVVGAFAIIAMETYFSKFGQWVVVAQGLAFIVCVLVFRRGLVGQLSKFLGRPL